MVISMNQLNQRPNILERNLETPDCFVCLSDEFCFFEPDFLWGCLFLAFDLFRLLLLGLFWFPSALLLEVLFFRLPPEPFLFW